MGGDDQRLADLMVAAQGGDAGAYETLLQACTRPAAAAARRVGVPSSGVDDVVQDVLLTIHRALATYDPARPFLPWLRAIANRRAIDWLRQHGRQGAREVHDPDAYLNQAAAEGAADEAADTLQAARGLRAAISTLPRQQRQAVELLGLQERSLDEASLQTGSSKGALKVNLHRALRALRGRLRDPRDV